MKQPDSLAKSVRKNTAPCSPGTQAGCGHVRYAAGLYDILWVRNRSDFAVLKEIGLLCAAIGLKVDAETVVVDSLREVRSWIEKHKEARKKEKP